MGDLSDNFDHSELVCSHCGQLPDNWPITNLQALRDKFGSPMKINSGYRCPLHPIEAAKGEPGAHAFGAVDVGVNGEQALRLVMCALDLGWAGYGIAQKGEVDSRYIHLDRMWERAHAPRPHIWSYD